MRIGILGPLEVRVGDRPVEIGGARLRALLTLLALDAGRVVPAERLIDDLWDDNPPAGAPNALQSLVSRLRATLGDGRELVESHAAGYLLAIDLGAVDAHDFEARVRRARRTGDPATAAAELREALALWRGPALSDVMGAPFAEGPIARLEGLRRAATEERIEADLALGRYAELIPELAALAAAEPLREPLRGQLMRALYGAGRQADALAVYDDTKRVLAQTLGVDPSVELERVHLAVLRQEPGLAPPAPPEPAGLDRPRTNIRAQLTSFIGRDEDLKRVGKLLGEGRLVTLTGPGGAGKTRLAMEAAARQTDQSADGVWIVTLAPVTDPAEIPQAVLSVLGLREMALLTRARSPGAVPEALEPLDRLAEALAGKRMLLLLDNCEHLVDAAARLADRLLADCPGVRILTTSREPLAITGEILWPVDPLALPPQDAGIDEAAAYPSVRLFTDRATAVRPDFAVTTANAGSVVRICRALDGMPLAIELAAARMRALSPDQVAARLGDRFRLLTAGSRIALPRHQTLRAVVEWSWELLDEREQALWRRLSIFTGGATVESAEAVCAGEGVTAAEMLDMLAALVDKSLLVVTETETEGPRYRMLETIRAYGMERLAEAGEEDRVRRAHAEYFAVLAETAEPELRRERQRHWLGRLFAEHDNIHTALRWAIGVPDQELAVRFCAALGWYWWLRGHRAEGSELAVVVQAMPDLPQDQTTALVYGLAAFGSIGGNHDFEQIKEWLRRARAICDAEPGPLHHPMLRALGPLFRLFETGMDLRVLDDLTPLFDDPDPWLRAFAHLMSGQVGLNAGLAADAGRHFGIGLEGFRALGEHWGTSFALISQAEISAWRGEHRHAVKLYEEARRHLVELGTGEDAPWVYTRFSNELWLLGEHDDARELVEEALRIAERTGSIESLAAVHFQMGEFARREGDLDEARRRMDRALSLADDLAGPHQIRAMVESGLGLVLAADGDTAGARTQHVKALEDAVASNDAPIIALVLVGFADLSLRQGDLAEVALLLGAADGIRGMPDLSLPDGLRLAAEARAALGAEAFTAAFERGRVMTVDDVLALLGVVRPPRFTL
ncbi:BTAD domain-containing putative transcriptional regulator [Actinomadura sp. HBU206391]|uniref:BTAD domain-containing putative transcriptional regulator n=1 Tax=Actinomadura sp. HBU206391 TaxID=2731692 RepID=UPI0016505527|nr:BTAD domain-containing putative transcriptional regulator [Actinomadura sp. HBU206391]MBC6458785.1 winged helix-turn-helix domain-containing protein [Actinomadura sp. HBU206391]